MPTILTPPRPRILGFIPREKAREVWTTLLTWLLIAGICIVFASAIAAGFVAAE